MEQFTFTDKAKKIFYALIAVGILSLIYGIVSPSITGQRVWSNVLINSWFFFGIGLTGTFFIAVSAAAQAGWVVVLKRIFEAISMYVPVGAVLMMILILGSAFGMNHLYHWMHPHGDALLEGKQAYLNVPFWIGRAVVFIGVYTLVTILFRKRSLKEDVEGNTRNYFFKNRVLAAIFLVFFGYTSVVASWDWLMSLDPHWFSTLYGWYIFAGMWCSGMVTVLLIALWLKSKGYLEQVNESHIHDMGKWVFATSFLWTYLWFSQFMLIWYSDMPEEVTYYMARLEDYTVPYMTMVMINFILPMLLLMSKDMKRHAGMLSFVGVIIFFGHWMDVYFIVTPGTLKDQGVIGIFEIGFMLGYLGVFLFTVFTALAKAPLVVKHHAMLDESLHHHIN
tara:strand:+ start:411 stop:1586 length:1176 start_codon:yes stop_codon:yes gene_type:complete